MSLAPSLLREQGLRELTGDDTAALQMWNLCRCLNPFAVKSSKTNLHCFLSYLAKGASEAELHSVRLLGYL